MYAIIETGGKQYRAQVGDKFRVEKINGETKTEVVFDKVLLVSDNGSVKTGNPYLDGARVTAEIVAQDRADKIFVFKYKSKKGYRRMRGHRQYYTEVVIRNISA